MKELYMMMLCVVVVLLCSSVSVAFSFNRIVQVGKRNGYISMSFGSMIRGFKTKAVSVRSALTWAKSNGSWINTNVSFMNLVQNVGAAMESLENRSSLVSRFIVDNAELLDCSAGASLLCCPTNQSLIPGADGEFASYFNALSSPPSEAKKLEIIESQYMESNITYNRNQNMLRVHRLTRGAIRKTPDEVLLGVLALISVELIQRFTTRQIKYLPTSIQEISGVLVSEVETKLEMFSYLQASYPSQPRFLSIVSVQFDILISLSCSLCVSMLDNL